MIHKQNKLKAKVTTVQTDPYYKVTVINDDDNDPLWNPCKIVSSDLYSTKQNDV